MKAFRRSGRFKVIVTMPLSSATLISSSDIRMKSEPPAVAGGPRSSYDPSATAGGSDSLSFEYRLAFVHVRVQAFFCIFGLEQLLLQFAFERQRGLEWYLTSCVHGALDSPDGARGFVGRRELARVSNDLLHKVRAGLRVEHLIDETEFLAALE